MPTPLPPYKGHTITLSDDGATFRAGSVTAPSLQALKKKLDALKPAPTFGQSVIVRWDAKALYPATVVKGERERKSRGNSNPPMRFTVKYRAAARLLSDAEWLEYAGTSYRHPNVKQRKQEAPQ